MCFIVRTGDEDLVLCAWMFILVIMTSRYSNSVVWNFNTAKQKLGLFTMQIADIGCT